MTKTKINGFTVVTEDLKVGKLHTVTTPDGRIAGPFPNMTRVMDVVNAKVGG